MSDLNQDSSQQQFKSSQIHYQDSCSKNTTENANCENEHQIQNRQNTIELEKTQNQNQYEDNFEQPPQKQQQQNQQLQESIQNKNQHDCEKKQSSHVEQQQDKNFLKNKISKMQYSIFLILLTILLFLFFTGNMNNLRQGYINLPKQDETTIQKLNTIGMSKEDYEKEIHKQLKGQRITLENIHQTDNDIYLEQTAVKTDLFYLKQRVVSHHVYEVYFLILLGKLEKMHELGIVHCDIKPQNIVISYDNEPFFNNFRSSVFQSDYSNYQKNDFTPQYNLKQYRNLNDESDKTNFNTKTFQNEEEIKVCDRTQLGLTFLYLFCEEVEDLQLFENKDYSALIDHQLNQLSKYQNNTNNEQMKIKHENKKIILQIINQILNKADQAIKLNEIQIAKQSFIIDFSVLQFELNKTNDVIFDKEKNIYYVRRIDSFSMKLLYLLDSLGSKLNINTDCMQIINQPKDSKEYQQFLEKYKSIEEYFKQINNISNFKKKFYNHKKPLNSECYFFNFAEYIQSDYFDKNQILEIPYVGYSRQFQYFIKSILKQPDTNNSIINLYLGQNELQGLIQLLNKSYPDFQIQRVQQMESLQYSGSFQLKGNLVKINNNEDQITNIELSLSSKSEVENLTKILTNMMKENTNIYYEINIKITFFSQFQFYGYKSVQDLIQIFENELKDINEVVNQFYQQQKPQIKLLRLRQSLDIDAFLSKINDMQNSQKCSNSIENDAQKTSDDNTNEQKKCHTIKSVNQQKAYGAFFINQLQNLRQKDQQLKSLKIIFYKYQFESKDIWEELREYLKSDQPNQISKILLIDCQFSQEVDEILEDFKLNYKNVKYNYFDQYDEQSSNEEFSSEFNIEEKYQLNVEQSYEYSQEQQLEIQFFKQFINKNQQKDNSLKTQYRSILFNEYQDEGVEENQEQIYVNENENEKEEHTQQQLQTIQSISNFIDLKQIYKSQLFNNISIPNSISHQIENIQKVNKVALINNQEDIDFLIQEIKNNVHFIQIEIDMGQYILYFLGQHLDINLNNLKTNKSIQKEELCEILINNYQCFNNLFIQTKSKSYQHYKIAETFQINRNGNFDPYDFEYKQFKSKLFSIFGEEDYFVLHYNFEATEFGRKYSRKSLFKMIEESNSNNDKIEESPLNDIRRFLSDNRLQSSDVFQYMLKEIVQQEKHVLVFNFKYPELTNESFIMLFEGIEKKYSHQIKQYKVKNNLDLKVNKIINHIYQIIRTYEQKQTVIFELQENSDLNYFEFKQFIKKIINDNNSHQEFQFEITSYYGSIVQQAEKEFKDYQLPQPQNNPNTKTKFFFQISLTKDYSKKLNLMSDLDDVMDFTQESYMINLTYIDRNKIQEFIEMLNSNQ